ncbi:hypothetical protein ACNRBH_02400 [Ralstonia pseudosolanacearum]|uniref:DUF7919 family protein n=1 Tax=Ralstonia pseudosolanacearum TaxID=1310165 RepID=UPI002676679E|nr:hypothetical protein [Ralstonia pseudosolanacearum]MDO3529685.1 hypothetical protein [Ralstonia pseudosolanacearum]MDO3534516.1 hypothetical protein [Ralstonia pseudosolanacearum]
MHYADLTPYSRQIAPATLSGVVNVGWLDIRSEFENGAVPAAFVERLKLIAGGVGDFKALVEPIRELPVCEICGEVDLRDAKGMLIPNAEIWVPAGSKIYASPITILHFIEVHGYRPPVEYINAVIGADLEAKFNADEVYRGKIKDSGWFRMKGLRK